MRISETFYSIQGEGELTGIPSVFIRTSGCNLRCRWCDTMYASWNPEGDEQSISELLSVVQAYPTRYVVLTGGEPMIAKGIYHLANRLKDLGKHITIETAGTVPPMGIPCNLSSISPKLSNSTPGDDAPSGWKKRHEATRWQPDIVKEWILHSAFQLKFVVETSEDLEEISEMVSQLDRPIPPEKILIMPEGTDAATIRGRDETLIDVCKRLGYRYCNRLHVELFGNTRGT